MSNILNLTEDERAELDSWLDTFIQALTVKELELQYRATLTVSSTAKLALENAATNLGVLGALATA